MVSKLTRRKFLTKTLGIGAAALGAFRSGTRILAQPETVRQAEPPIVISTWDHGVASNEGAMKALRNGMNALDAAEQGVNVSENDPDVHSVGLGGYPDEDGIVTLDACIMDWQWRCGSVGALQDIKNPVSVARQVMEVTDHIMLVGEGAKTFALRMGFPEDKLLTEPAREWWLNWKRELSSQDDWLVPEDVHDTIGMLVLDTDGHLAGACTTSGLAGKIHGRVGDSPLIGSGLYVDGEIGGAAATGRGEEFIRTNGTHLVVENMRRGMSPQNACEDALRRIVKINGGMVDFQGAFVALSINGEIGAASLQPGFQYALFAEGRNELYDGKHLMGD